MKLPARNQLRGKAPDIKKDPVSAEGAVDIGGVTVVSSITTTSAEELQLKIGDEAAAVIKASSVIIAKN